ncbi:hypothetical protein AB0L05_27715 [Nonomuraea pusilla]|uniref:hypothetical protein n=1 Tax=Nonomuraea pusilla TaxID=46177 RepID=UPI0033213311
MADIDVPHAPALVTVPGVELAQAGTWRLSSGETTITREDLAAAVGALDCPAVRNPVLKLGHVDPRFDGEPAMGWVGGMRLADDGNTIVGDYRGVPNWLAAVMASAYPDRSIEGVRDWPCQIGHVHQLVIHAVALLGVAMPGIGTLASLQDVAALYDVAASEPAGGEPVTTTIRGGSMPPPTPELAAGVSSEDVRRRYYENVGYSRWICEIQLDPLQLIVMDDSTGGYFRVPVSTSGDEVEFGEAVAVSVEYVDKPSKMAAAAVYASREESIPQELRAASVSDKPWSDFKESDYTIEQWRKACLIAPDTASESKSDYKLPVREPSGTLNRNGCHAAASRIGQVSGVSDDAKKAAAKKLVSLYKNELDEDPPESLTKLAGMDAAAPSEPPAPGEPATQTPVTNPVSGPTKQEDTDMQFSDEQAAKLRTALGLPEGTDLDPAALLDGVEKLAASGESSPGKTPKNAPGTVTVDRQVWDDMQTRIQNLEKVRASQQRNDRERMVDDAIRAGKFAPSRRDHWLRVAEADPEGTAQLLAGLTPGTVPVADNGLPGGEGFDLDAEFAGLFPPEGV